MNKDSYTLGATKVSENEVRQALAKVMDPELRRSIVDLGMVRDLWGWQGFLHAGLDHAGLPAQRPDRADRQAGRARPARRPVRGYPLAEMTAQEKATLRRG